MATNLPYLAVMNYSDYFTDRIPEDRLFYLKAYPTEFILLKISKINAHLYQEKDLKAQTLSILTEVIFLDSPVAGQELVNMINATDWQYKTFFSAAANSLLIKACLENFVEDNPEQLVNPTQLARDLFKTILIFNQIYYGQIHGHDLESFRGLFTMEILQQNYIRTDFNAKLITLLKFAFISKFMDEHTEIKSDCIEFCKNFELGNPWLYGKLFLQILSFLTIPDQKGRHILDTAGLPMKLIEEFTMDQQMIQNKAGISLTMDIIPKPFYLLMGEYPMILDIAYFQYAIDQGFFFCLYNNSSLKKSLKFKKYPDFKAYIGLHYFEKYLVKKYIDAIFYRRNQKVISNDKYQDFIVKASSDTVFIFEVKMADVHAKTIESLDFDVFKIHIDDNFLQSKEISGKNKGLPQILKQMSYLKEANGELCQLLDIGRSKPLNIYPILVYSDINLDTAGVNEYVNEQIIDRFALERKDFQSLKPVLMLNVNTFIEYYSVLKKDPKQLAGWIADYFKVVSKRKRIYDMEGGPHKFSQYNISFTTYLRNKVTGDLWDQNLSEMRSDFNLNIDNYGA